MQFPGYWVEENDDRVVIHTATFDETELDPATDWKVAWQNQGADSNPKGFVETGKALAYAVRLIARNQSREISDAEILTMQGVSPLFNDGKCELHNLEDFRLLCLLLNSIPGMRPKVNSQPAIELPEAVDEIPFN